MILGFTGTREGMSPVQREAVAEFLRRQQPSEVHHGDCVGADSEFQDAAILACSPRIVIHPANMSKWRARRKGDVVHSPKPPKERNRDIVKAIDHLAAGAKLMQSETRSGTWATVRLAMAARKPVTVFWPDGTVQAWGYTSLREIFTGS